MPRFRDRPLHRNPQHQQLLMPVAALSSKFTLASRRRACSFPSGERIISTSEASTASKALYSVLLFWLSASGVHPSSPAGRRVFSEKTAAGRQLDRQFLKYQCGVSAATFSISIPPAGDAMITGRCVRDRQRCPGKIPS